jgi:hypothetical protein
MEKLNTPIRSVHVNGGAALPPQANEEADDEEEGEESTESEAEVPRVLRPRAKKTPLESALAQESAQGPGSRRERTQADPAPAAPPSSVVLEEDICFLSSIRAWDAFMPSRWPVVLKKTGDVERAVEKAHLRFELLRQAPTPNAKWAIREVDDLKNVQTEILSLYWSMQRYVPASDRMRQVYELATQRSMLMCVKRQDLTFHRVVHNASAKAQDARAQAWDDVIERHQLISAEKDIFSVVDDATAKALRCLNQSVSTDGRAPADPGRQPQFHRNGGGKKRKKKPQKSASA